METLTVQESSPQALISQAIEFDKGIFDSDEAIAKRFRDANNKDTINN
jgi:hypothetical protein